MEFITVATFSLPNEAHIVKGRLESEGINCFLKDENTVQVYNFYSNAIGGIKLQVLEVDVAQAVNLLIELGYLKKSDFTQESIWNRFEKYSNSIPLLSNLKTEVRFFILLFTLIVLIVSLAFLAIPEHYTNLAK